MATDTDSTFFGRHEFLIRRLHSLSGLVPVGAYMLVHLATNASVLNGASSYQGAVYNIQSLGVLLPVVEWAFIFLPILFHAIVGVVIVAGGLPNNNSYPYKTNFGYTLQRATGMIAFAFILWHVFHMHGWFHNAWWLHNVAEPLGGAQFRPYSAASSLGQAMGSVIVVVLYAIGVLSCVYHLSYGFSTSGITWGVWVTPEAQSRAGKVALGLGLLLGVVAMSALVGAATVDVPEARVVEEKMYEFRQESGEIEPDEHKRADHSEEVSAKP